MEVTDAALLSILSLYTFDPYFFTLELTVPLMSLEDMGPLDATLTELFYLVKPCAPEKLEVDAFLGFRLLLCFTAEFVI